MTLFGGIEYEGLVPHGTRGTGIHGPETRNKERPATSLKKLKLALLDDTTVRVDNCGLSSIPEEVLRKTKLRELILSRNRISTIQPAIGNLKTLRTLRVDQNALVIVPGELGQLANLQTLDLSGNQLASVPVELGLCAELQSLNLLENPLDGVVPGDSGLTFMQVYMCGKPETARDASQREAVIRRGTKALLTLLRENLDPEVHGEFMAHMAAVRQAEAAHKLRDTMVIADAERLQRVLEAAEKAGVPEGGLLSRAHEALAVLQELAAAMEEQDAQRLKAALKQWQAHVKPAATHGKDYEAARQLLKKLQQQEAERGWQTRATGPNDRVSSASGSSRQARADAEAAETRRREMQGFGTMSYEQWLEEKEAKVQREREAFLRFQAEMREAQARRAAEKEAERQRLKEMEKGWPSRIMAEVRPGTFSKFQEEKRQDSVSPPPSEGSPGAYRPARPSTCLPGPRRVITSAQGQYRSRPRPSTSPPRSPARAPKPLSAPRLAPKIVVPTSTSSPTKKPKSATSASKGSGKPHASASSPPSASPPQPAKAQEAEDDYAEDDDFIQEDHDHDHAHDHEDHAVEQRAHSKTSGMPQLVLLEPVMEEPEPTEGPSTPLPDSRPKGTKRRDWESIGAASPSSSRASSEVGSTGRGAAGSADRPITSHTHARPSPLGLTSSSAAGAELNMSVSLDEFGPSGPSGPASHKTVSDAGRADGDDAYSVEDFEGEGGDGFDEEEEEAPLLFIESGKSVTDLPGTGHRPALPLWAADIPTPGAVMADEELLSLPAISIIGDIPVIEGQGGPASGMARGSSPGNEAGELSFAVDKAGGGAETWAAEDEGGGSGEEYEADHHATAVADVDAIEEEV